MGHWEEEPGDVPFLVCELKAPLPDLLVMHGLSIDVDAGLMTCHISDSDESFTFHRAFFSFIIFLNCVNSEITQTWTKEKKKDKAYWISLRAYLNLLLKNTLLALNNKEKPTALFCWLHREFLLCCHNEKGRKEYLKLAHKHGITPYSVDTFSIDWPIWWDHQVGLGYYDPSHFQKFTTQLKVDWQMIKATKASDLWGSSVGDSSKDQPEVPRPSPDPPQNEEGDHGSDRSERSEPLLDLDGPTLFDIFASKAREPPKGEDGMLDWVEILKTVCSLEEAFKKEEPNFQLFLDAFDQARWLDMELLEEFEELHRFITAALKPIHKLVVSHRRELKGYLESKWYCEEVNIEADIDRLCAWFDQFSQVLLGTMTLEAWGTFPGSERWVNEGASSTR
ncbi:hypothetical protein BJ138DRAFT_1106836 [Hygrophoropsis aurantiaca]|uniref:Uncharacterized protein n=1 Tax=Hygrophoropsis aurantiaca TaxID=72124 RepID=A0ACB7ZUR9_9AGAM|nr:hypothetical protein BJ138DRAFT_1106836 [Hygrophoropsis aurantiaca]